jgi:Fe-S cluster biogenesis protein NfuA
LFTNEEKHIISILDQYVKPAVESDGGDISLKSFKNNIVTVQLKGACNGCPSASMTLPHGIEALLLGFFYLFLTVVSE